MPSRKGMTEGAGNKGFVLPTFHTSLAAPPAGSSAPPHRKPPPPRPLNRLSRRARSAWAYRSTLAGHFGRLQRVGAGLAAARRLSARPNPSSPNGVWADPATPADRGGGRGLPAWRPSVCGCRRTSRTAGLVLGESNPGALRRNSARRDSRTGDRAGRAGAGPRVFVDLCSVGAAGSPRWTGLRQVRRGRLSIPVASPGGDSARKNRSLAHFGREQVSSWTGAIVITMRGSDADCGNPSAICLRTPACVCRHGGSARVDGQCRASASAATAPCHAAQRLAEDWIPTTPSRKSVSMP